MTNGDPFWLLGTLTAANASLNDVPSLVPTLGSVLGLALTPLADASRDVEDDLAALDVDRSESQVVELEGVPKG